MSSQTARRPDNRQRSAHSAKSKKYTKQTAHVEARRDGKPLIFGWGGHLSHKEKNKIKRRAVWASGIAFFLIIVIVLGGFWLDLNVIIPNSPITSVNGQNISQNEFRQLVAVKAQLEENKIKGPKGLTAQSDNLKNQGNAAQTTVNTLTTKSNTLTNQLKSASASQKASLQSQLNSVKTQLSNAQGNLANLSVQYQTISQTTIPNEQQLFTQSQVGSDSATWLQDNLLIQDWLAKQSSAVQAKVQPSAGSVNAAVRDMINNLPTSKNYQQFLSAARMNDADVHAMMTIIQRRTNMQNYLASQINSPTYQVEARAMTLATQPDANAILTQLQHGADFSALAKKKSVDTHTNSKGGDLGWLARGEYTLNDAQNVSGVVDNWIFDPARKVNEISPVLKENGTFHVVQITAIDPSRPLDQGTLSALRNNALQGWLFSQRALPGTNVTSVNQNMLNDSNNMPPNLPAAAPAQQSQQPGAGGVPSTGGVPGGQPAPGTVPGQ